MGKVDDNFRDIALEVERNGGIQNLTMEKLRDAYDAGRLGQHVRNGISSKLTEHGLGHLPKTLPTYQTDEVRLYELGKPIAKVIDAVLEPCSEGDRFLRDVAGSDAREIIQKIRELVCD